MRARCMQVAFLAAATCANGSPQQRLQDAMRRLSDAFVYDPLPALPSCPDDCPMSQSWTWMTEADFPDGGPVPFCSNGKCITVSATSLLDAPAVPDNWPLVVFEDFELGPGATLQGITGAVPPSIESTAYALNCFATTESVGPFLLQRMRFTLFNGGRPFFDLPIFYACPADGDSESASESSGTGTGTASESSGTGTGTGSASESSGTGTGSASESSGRRLSGTGSASESSGTGTGTESESSGTGTASESSGTGTASESSGTGTGSESASESECGSTSPNGCCQVDCRNILDIEGVVSIQNIISTSSSVAKSIVVDFTVLCAAQPDSLACKKLTKYEIGGLHPDIEVPGLQLLATNLLEVCHGPMADSPGPQ